MEDIAKIGSSVEVKGPYSYYVGRVVGHGSDNRIVVEYNSPITALLEEKPVVLRNKFCLSRIRPSPEIRVSSFILYDNVDVFLNTAWWEGVIIKRIDTDTRCVCLEGSKRRVNAPLANLRSHLEWINGQWVPPPVIGIPPPVSNHLSEHEVMRNGSSYRGLMKEMCQLNVDRNLHAKAYFQIREAMNQCWGILPVEKYSQYIVAVKLKLMGFNFDVDCLLPHTECYVREAGFRLARKPEGFCFKFLTDAQITEMIDRLDGRSLNNSERFRRRALEFEYCKRKAEKDEEIRKRTYKRNFSSIPHPNHFEVHE